MFDYCMKNNRDYQKLRIEIFGFEEEVQEYMNYIEGDGLCDAVSVAIEFYGFEEFNKVACNKLLDNLMSHGLTNTYQYIVKEVR